MEMQQRASQIVTPSGVERTKSAVAFYDQLLGPPSFGSSRMSMSVSASSTGKMGEGAASRRSSTEKRASVANDEIKYKVETDMRFTCADFADRCGILGRDDVSMAKFKAYGGEKLMVNIVNKYDGVVSECSCFALAHLTSAKNARSLNKILNESNCAKNIAKLCSGKKLLGGECEEGSVRSALVSLTNMTTAIDIDQWETSPTINALKHRVDDLKSLLDINSRSEISRVSEDGFDGLDPVASDVSSRVYDHSSLLFGATLHLLSVMSKFDILAEPMFREGIFDIACRLVDTVKDERILENCAIILGNMLGSRSSVRTNSEALGIKAEDAHSKLSVTLGVDSQVCSQLRAHIARLQDAKNEFRRRLSTVGHVITHPRVLILHNHHATKTPGTHDAAWRRNSQGSAHSAFVLEENTFDMMSAMKHSLHWIEANRSYISHTKSYVDKASVFDVTLTATSARRKLKALFSFENEPLLILQCSLVTAAHGGDWVFAGGVKISFVEVMDLWINSKAKRSGTVLLILTVSDHSGATVEQAHRTRVSQLVVHSSCRSHQTSSIGSFFDCFAKLQREKEGNDGMNEILGALDNLNMHPQLYVSPDLRKESLSQTAVRVILNDSGRPVLMIGLLRGLMIRLIS